MGVCSQHLRSIGGLSPSSCPVEPVPLRKGPQRYYKGYHCQHLTPVMSYQGKEGFLPLKSIQMEAFSHAQELLRWLWIVVKKGLGSGCIPGRLDHLVEPGAKSCSHVQGTADCHFWGQEWIFSPGPIPDQIVVSRFFASLCSTEQSPCQGYPRPFWVSFCLLVLQQLDAASSAQRCHECPALGSAKCFFSLGYTDTVPQGFFALLGHTEHIL